MLNPPVFLSAVVLALAGGLATPLAAAPLSQILAQSPLKPGDFDAMRAAERTLYEAAGTRSGSSVKWSNPETSAHGAVKVTGSEGGCLSLRHTAFPGGASAARKIDRKFCKSASGQWLLSE
ncbi:MAG: hypothetical protein BM559_04235 [Roseobacter sp. MedPE-SWchi]|nr:MAG: hypothetical protein BM559_04235 [Roseobacter sp. MedPE-SWchi]